ncbi:hypothetical protein B0H14DRAFT_851628 [Mycena olivaceomarginata]|nr:hypothetical protein B0H14DRAFT_851628 [Mycena olivaceomarginata]
MDILANALKQKPTSFFKDSVHNVFVGFTGEFFHPSFFSQIRSFLDACTGIITLYIADIYMAPMLLLRYPLSDAPTPSDSQGHRALRWRALFQGPRVPPRHAPAPPWELVHGWPRPEHLGQLGRERPQRVDEGAYIYPASHALCLQQPKLARARLPGAARVPSARMLHLALSHWS